MTSRSDLFFGRVCDRRDLTVVIGSLARYESPNLRYSDPRGRLGQTGADVWSGKRCRPAKLSQLALPTACVPDREETLAIRPHGGRGWHALRLIREYPLSGRRGEIRALGPFHIHVAKRLFLSHQPPKASFRKLLRDGAVHAVSHIQEYHQYASYRTSLTDHPAAEKKRALTKGRNPEAEAHAPHGRCVIR